MRYTGPKWRINRREGTTVLGRSEKWKRRMTLPGQFPSLSRRPTDYAIQFREKQKVKRMYGMNESQFKRFYNLALKFPGNTSTRLLQLLELRTDNFLFKLGMANSRAQARQFINHGHILLNGSKHNIASTILKVGDEIIIKDGLLPKVNEILSENKAVPIPSWVSKLDKGGKVNAEPTRDEIDQMIKERLIIELYSRQ